MLEQDISSYMGKLKAVWARRIHNISKRTSSGLVGSLDREVRTSSVAMITWSDGRQENYPTASGMDITICWPSQWRTYIPSLLQDVFAQQLEVITSKTIQPKINFETLSLNDIKKLLFYNWDENRFFPTRLLDAQYIYWNKDIFNELKQYLFLQLKDLEKKFYERWRNRIRSHRKISETWKANFKWNEINYFDPENGIVYYEKRESDVVGVSSLETWVKIWPMRFMQYKTASLIIKAIQNEKISLDEFLKIPNFLWDRLEFLRDLFDWIHWEQDLNDMTISYYYFVKMHHHLQHLFKQWDWEAVELELNPNDRMEFVEYLQTLNHLASSLQLK